MGIFSRKLNIIIPMAGRGQRFIDAGYTTPKPLMRIDGELIIKKIIDTMRISDCQFIFIVRKDHCDEFELDKRLLEIEPSAKIIKINEITQGAICTVLLAKEYFNNENPVIIKDCDQIVNWDPLHFMELVLRNNADGAIVNIHTDSPNYSFSRINSKGHITETAEKSLISNHGSVGIYYFNKGIDLIKYAERMIEKNLRVNNEFYTSPVYNQLIQAGKNILHYPIAEMFQLGTPEDLAENQNKVINFFNSKFKKQVDNSENSPS
jgi:NDP-sugar pyrophosphorylase family protein